MKKQVEIATNDYLKAVIEDMELKKLYNETAIQVKASHYKVQKAKQEMEDIIKIATET